MQCLVLIVLLTVFSLCCKADVTDSVQLQAETTLMSTQSVSGIARDSATTKIVDVNNGILDTYRNSKDYDYGFDPPPTSSFGAALNRWLKQKLSEFFAKAIPYDVWDVLLYILAIGSIITVVASIMKTGVFTLITGKNPQNVSFAEISDDIHGMDFPALIAQSLREGEYRYSVRLHYLHILKILTDRGVIVWKPEKTNREYYRDLEPTILSEPFVGISRIFDYVWYGERRITEQEYKEIEQQFEICKQLAQKKI